MPTHINSQELPEVQYKSDPILIAPDLPTPKDTLYLSNLDNEKLQRVSTIKYLYLYEKSVDLDKLKRSLSRVLSYYYPLAGRLIYANNDDNNNNDNGKLEVECNGKGALFVEAYMDYTVEKFLGICDKPDKSLRNKLLYNVSAKSFLDIPPLVIQVTNLMCGGMIMCTAINHCICDGIGSSHFLNAWAHITSHPDSDPPITLVHTRDLLKPRLPLQFPNQTNLAYSHFIPENTQTSISQYLKSQPLVQISITLSLRQILHLKGHLKCTNFEALATYTWRAWVQSLDLPCSLKIKLLFPINIRKKLRPILGEGYYGNGLVWASAESTVEDLVSRNLNHGIELVQQAKDCLIDDYVRSIVDLLEDKAVIVDVSDSMLMSQWCGLRLEDVDFGERKPVYMGPLDKGICCLFLPVVGEPRSMRVYACLPEIAATKFKFYMKEGFAGHAKENGY